MRHFPVDKVRCIFPWCRMFGFLTAPCSGCSSKEHSVYRAHFCGLCNRLRRDYGLPARFLVNRDATFLSLLGDAMAETGREPASATCCNPLGKPRLVYQEGPAVEYAADVTLCGLHAKLDDEAADARSRPRAWAMQGLRGALSRPVRRAVARLDQRGFPIDEVQGRLAEQGAVEHAIAQSGRVELAPLSAPTAFSFGHIVAYAGHQAQGALNQIGQSLGRMIYTLDAVVDRKQDERRGQFNPFLLQPSLLAGVPHAMVQEQHAIAEALEDVPLQRHRELIGLILGRNLARTCDIMLGSRPPDLHPRATWRKRQDSDPRQGPSWLCCSDCCTVGTFCDCGCDGCDGCGCDC